VKKSMLWTLSFVISAVLCLAAFAAVMYVTDPLLQYGTESKLFSYYEYGEMYSNPGIAEHYEYDAVMVGTSMIENTDVDECDELFGCNMVRLPYSGGTSYNMKTILDVCFRSDNNIKNVYWELDEFQLLGSSTEPRYPLPEYLYRDDCVKDASYLLNIDIFYHYTMNNLLGTLKGQEQNAERRHETLFGVFGKEAMLSTYQRPEKQKQQTDASKLIKKVDENLDANIIPLIEANPGTKFTFFFVPFSVLYWDKEVQNGTFDITMDAVKHAINRLLEYENVTIFFYHNETEIITNLDNYKDYSHYSKDINSWMTKSMAAGHGLVTRENADEVVENMREFVHAYDFETLFK
jgi:hypothetical protein